MFRKIIFTVCVLNSHSIFCSATEKDKPATQSMPASSTVVSNLQYLRPHAAGARVLNEKDMDPVFQDPACQWAFDMNLDQKNKAFKQIHDVRTRVEKLEKMITSQTTNSTSAAAAASQESAESKKPAAKAAGKKVQRYSTSVMMMPPKKENLTTTSACFSDHVALEKRIHELERQVAVLIAASQKKEQDTN